MDLFHPYIWGTAFWYGLRGAARIYDSAMVCDWFRNGSQTPNSLELYTINTDAWGLVTLALILLSLTNVMPINLPFLSSPKSTSTTPSSSGAKTIAKAVILATIFHHVTTGYGAYTYWADPNRYTKAMSVGVYGCAGLATLGAAVLAFGMEEGRTVVGGKKIA